jgi:hypothetical protein
VTDPELVHRAEQAYLGALLARQGRPGTGTAVAGDGGPDAFAGLRPQDFADPVHQAVYAALASQAQPARTGVAGIYELLRAMLTRLLSPRARAAAAYMAGLPGLCPDQANMAAYAAMVTEASQARAVPTSPARPPQQVVPEDPTLASAAQWLDATRAGRHQPVAPQATPAYTAPPSQPKRTLDGLDPRTERLARALGRDVRRLAGRAAPPADPSPAPAGNQAEPLGAHALQEQALADLMLHPASRGDIVDWLSPQAFDAGHNRTLYQLIRIRLDSGRPVDPLIIAWDASTLAGMSDTAAKNSESLAAAALRIGTLNTAPGTAAAPDRALYAEHVRSGAVRPDWPKVRIPAPPSASASGPASPAEQAAAAARRPAPAPPRHPSGLPLRRPPLPGQAEPGPAPRR